MTGECRSQGPPASHSKDNPNRRGVSRFASQTQPQELTNRRFKPWVTALGHDQRTNPSSLPDMHPRFCLTARAQGYAPCMPDSEVKAKTPFAVVCADMPSECIGR